MDALKFVLQLKSAPSQRGMVFGSGAISQRKTAHVKRGLKGTPFKSRSSLSLGRTTDRATRDWLVSGEREQRAAEIIVKCVQVGLWDEARRVYAFVAANGTEIQGSGACSSLSLGQIQKDALALLGKTNSAEAGDCTRKF